MSILPPRLLVAITGASGAMYGIRALQMLRDLNIEAHLILTPTARLTIAQETEFTPAQVEALAAVSYDPNDLAAPPASGSFVTQGMLVAPCSIKALSAVANSYTADLMARAADVCLKEGRPVLLALRETPLHLGHIRLLQQAAEAGAIIFPPVPAFYAHPHSLGEMVTHSVARMLLRLGIENPEYKVWGEEK